MRNILYINKLWNNFMRKKMEKEMRSSQQIDDAFKQIKTATGVTDVQAMVRRFQQREQTYSQLLITVSSSEAKIDNLKKDNEELSKRLHELQIDSGDNQGTAGTESQDTEIIQMNAEIGTTAVELQKLQDRFKRINIVNDQIGTWAKRVFQKFSVLSNDPAFQKEPEDMSEIFSYMNSLTNIELTQLKEREGMEEPDFGETFNDFATEDFINKNIRVRPVSGVTHPDETRDGR